MGESGGGCTDRACPPGKGSSAWKSPPGAKQEGDPRGICFPEEGAGADGQQSRAVLLTLFLTALMNLNG